MMVFLGIPVHKKMDVWKYTILVLFGKALVPSVAIPSISTDREISISSNSEYILLVFDSS